MVKSQLRKSEPCRRNGITPKRSFRSFGKPTFCWAKDKSVSQVCKQIGVSDQTYYRWRKIYGGMKVDQAKRLKELEAENARLKRAVADLTVDKLILKEVAEGKY